MTRATIIITDEDDTGNVQISLEFDPPLEGMANSDNATAQYLAAKAVSYLEAVCSADADSDLCPMLDCACTRVNEQAGKSLCVGCPHALDD